MGLWIEGMNEVWKGVFSADDHNTTNKSKLIVAVHPFFLSDARFAEKCPAYRPALVETLYRTHAGPIVTLEELSRLGYVLPRYRSLRASDMYFVPTFDREATPVEASWAVLAEFLASFGRRRAGLMGGYLGECLRHVKEMLNKYDLKTNVIKELTFD